MKKAYKRLFTLTAIIIILLGMCTQPAGARGPMSGNVGYFHSANTTIPFNSVIAYNNTTFGNVTSGNHTAERETNVTSTASAPAEEKPNVQTPSEEAERERRESEEAVTPKNHMQFELSTGVPRSISYWKPVNDLLAQKIGEKAGVVAMRLTGLSLGGRRVDMAGRVFL